MLSDRFLRTKLLLASALLSAMCVGNYLATPARLDRDLQERFELPAEQKEPLRVGFVTVDHVGPDGTARVVLRGREVEVAYSGEPWREQDVVSFSGWVTPEGRIRVAAFTVHRARGLKRLVSLAAVFVFTGALILKISERRACKGGICRT